MPYASMDEVNPAIKGIDPPVTLAQANIIAEWADKIEDQDLRRSFLENVAVNREIVREYTKSDRGTDP